MIAYVISHRTEVDISQTLFRLNPRVTIKTITVSYSRLNLIKMKNDEISGIVFISSNNGYLPNLVSNNNNLGF